MSAAPNRIPVAALVTVAVAGLALLTLGAAYRFGPLAFALPAALAVGALAVRRVEVGVGALLVAAVIAENEDYGFPPTAALYENLVPLISAFDLLFFAALAAVALDCARRRELPTLPRPLLPGLALLLVAVACGMVTGYFAGGKSGTILSTALAVSYLIGTPILVASVIRTPRQARVLLLCLLAVVTVKAAFGIATVALGISAAKVDGSGLTYLAPTMNWLTVIVLVAGVVAVFRGLRPSPWLVFAWLLCSGSLVLSYRRSFWIVAVLALVLAVMLGLSQLQRRLAVPAVILVVAGIWLVLSSGVATDLQGPVVERVQSLSPTAIAANRTDTYRIDERRNVIADLARHPLDGLGIGVPWTARYPLGLEYQNGRQYTHVATLWFWMKLGILGPIAYLLLMGSAAVAAARAGRRHADPWLAAFAVAAAGCLVALVVGELTATFTGVDRRFNVVLGALLGMVAALAAQARRQDQLP